jgi:hypothetical protein
MLPPLPLIANKQVIPRDAAAAADVAVAQAAGSAAVRHNDLSSSISRSTDTSN